MSEEKLELQDIQKVELELLKELIRVCKENGLRCWLACGSLIGAVRHQGFIPWDDDIDVLMPRPDYEKLMKLDQEKNLFCSYMELHSFENGKYDYPYGKLVDNRTRMAYRYVNSKSQHVWIDIFPMEGLPVHASEYERNVRKANRLRMMIVNHDAKLGTGTTWYYAFAKIPVVLVSRLHPVRYYSQKIIDMAKHYDFESSEKVGRFVWGGFGMNEIMNKKDLYPETTLKFEGEDIPVFACWNAYLKRMFNDYMTLPPEHKRKHHHYDAWIQK